MRYAAGGWYYKRWCGLSVDGYSHQRGRASVSNAIAGVRNARLDDSQMDARAEIDFSLVKNVVEQGHASARVMIQLDLEHILRRFEALQSAEVTLAAGGNTEAMFEEYHARTRNTVVGTTDQRVWGRSSGRGRVPCSHHPRCHHSTTRPWRVRCTLRLCRISWPREWNQ